MEASTYYTLSLWRFRAMQFILSGMAAAELRNVLLVDLRDMIFQASLQQAPASSPLSHACWLVTNYYAGGQLAAGAREQHHERS